jgi:hypothetical protein
MSKSVVDKYSQILAQDPSSTVFVELAKAFIDKGDHPRAIEVSDLHHADAHLPLGERRGATLLVALRPWELDEFRALRRKKPARKG